MIHFEFTGRVSFAAIVGGALFAWFLQEIPTIFEGRDMSEIAVIRWTALVLFCGVIFTAGWRSNRKKAMRRSPTGKMMLGSPNTIFYMPLQYWAFIYLLLLARAITVWQTKKL